MATFMTAVDRRAYAQTMFEQHPELFPEDRRQSILDGVIVLGMTPFEAKLAGGAFAYKVIVDTTRWPEGVNPLKVMWAQSMQADNSSIWMMFKNSSQYRESGATSFRVCFERGCAKKIERLKGDESEPSEITP
jgi:hypothetical protein